MYNLKDVNRSVNRTINRFSASKPAFFCYSFFFLKMYTADCQGGLNKRNIYFIIIVIIKLTI